MIKTKKQMYVVIGIFALVMLLTTVTYAFFNYTRTGVANTIKTGRIYFNTSQGNTINLTNMFPIASSEVDSANLDSITVNIVGDTTYPDGEEYEISIVDVTNRIGKKKVPINFVATYNPTPVATGEDPNTIGTNSDNYYTTRKSKSANIYLLNPSGEVEEGKQILLGYIKNDSTGINGTLTIKAYLDSSRISISDTYPPIELVYKVNSEMTQTEINACVTLITNIYGPESSAEGDNQTVEGDETYHDFCSGTGTILGYTLQEFVDNERFRDEEFVYLEENNVIIFQGYSNGTTDEWVNGRTVLTTTEWNSLQNTPISFKVRAESNEGIWVTKPSKGIESCPDCKFMYYVVDPSDITTAKWTTWNNRSQTPTQITTGLYENYEELIATTGKNYFLGVKLNSNNEVTNAYACGVKDETPFCIEGPGDGSKYTANQILLQGANLYNNSCSVHPDSETGYGYDYVECGPWDNSGSLSAYADSIGLVYAGVGDTDRCTVGPFGNFGCFGSDSGGGGVSP